MRNKLSKPNKKGFTIIEIMIVLAIAGLILLIVFLAVPALQRNSRNTQRKSDVAAVLAAVNEFASNNNGTTPTTCSGAASPYTIGTGTTSQVKVGYFNKGCVASGVANGQVEILAGYAATGPFAAADHDYAVVVPSASCTTNASGAAVTGAGSARQVAVVYEIETGSGSFASVCQES